MKTAFMGFSGIKRLIGMMDHPAAFLLVRDVINLGRNQGPVRKHMDVRPGESVLDVGCGCGVSTAVLPDGCDYLGVDISGDYIRYAKRRYGSGSNRFELGDARTYPFGEDSFDKVMMIYMLHHTSDLDCEIILPRLAAAARERIVIIDLLPVPGRRFQSWLMSLDRGEHIRTLEEQERLLGRFFGIREVSRFETRSGSATSSVFVLDP